MLPCQAVPPDFMFDHNHEDFAVKVVCGNCPVVQECWKKSQEFEKYPQDCWGVWGGLTQSQRRKMLHALPSD